MFSVRFRRRVRVRVRRPRRCRRRRQDFCISRQNRLSFTLDILDEESIGLGKCSEWPFGDLDQGRGCDIDKHKFACLQNKVRTTHPITTQLGNIISLAILITWLDFGGNL